MFSQKWWHCLQVATLKGVLLKFMKNELISGRYPNLGEYEIATCLQHLSKFAPELFVFFVILKIKATFCAILLGI